MKEPKRPESDSRAVPDRVVTGADAGLSAEGLGQTPVRFRTAL
jgi:hypothetical protein